MQALRSLGLIRLLGPPLALLALLLTLAAPAFAGGPAGFGDDGDRIVFSGPVDVPAGQTVGDVVAFDGAVTIDGRANGDVVSLGGPVRIAGSVDGDVVSLAERLTLSPAAVVGGDLVYGEDRPVVAAGAVVDGDVQRADASSWFGDRFGGDRFGSGPFDEDFGWIGWLGSWLAVSLSSLVLGLGLLRLAPGSAQRALEIGLKRVRGSIGYGLALLFGVPIAAVMLMVTIVGIPLGIALLLGLVPLVALGYTVGAWVLGRMVTASRRKSSIAFLAGWGILRLIALVPILGGLVGFAATVFGLGVLVLLALKARDPRRPRPPLRCRRRNIEE